MYKKYVEQFKDPLILLLLGSAVMSLVIKQYDDAVSIFMAVTIVATVSSKPHNVFYDLKTAPWPRLKIFVFLSSQVALILENVDFHQCNQHLQLKFSNC